MSSPSLAQSVPPLEQQRPRRVSPPAEQINPDEVLRIDTDLVTVDVTVTDAAGQPVRNLRAEDFKLYEDEAERPIAFYNVEKRSGQLRPLAIVFALDVSGSMTAEEMSRLQEAMNHFSRRLAVDAHRSLRLLRNDVKTLRAHERPAKLERAFARLPRVAERTFDHRLTTRLTMPCDCSCEMLHARASGVLLKRASSS